MLCIYNKLLNVLGIHKGNCVRFYLFAFLMVIDMSVYGAIYYSPDMFMSASSWPWNKSFSILRIYRHI